MILGVDPGNTGSLSIIEPGSLQHVDHMLMPLIAHGKNKRVNAAAIKAWISQYPIQHGFIELVNAMPSGGKGPKMGSASAFTFGHAAGQVQALLVGMDIPFTLVHPTKWKTHAGLIGTEKDAARSRAIQLYPTLRDLDLKAKGQAIADALLIARYGEHTLH